MLVTLQKNWTNVGFKRATSTNFEQKTENFENYFHMYRQSPVKTPDIKTSK